MQYLSQNLRRRKMAYAAFWGYPLQHPIAQTYGYTEGAITV